MAVDHDKVEEAAGIQTMVVVDEMLTMIRKVGDQIDGSTIDKCLFTNGNIITLTRAGIASCFVSFRRKDELGPLLSCACVRLCLFLS